MTQSQRDIQILLSTYNGAKYITAQLDSLRTQDCAERISVLVRDDGSIDGTVPLVESFETGPLAIRIIQGENIGVKQSFLELMRSADITCTSFFFCDQDDVWGREKVSTAVRALHSSQKPTLYCGRSVIADANLKPLGVTAPAPRGPSFRNALIQCIAPGHTMAFNAPLLTLARETFDPERAIMHDHWMYLLASGLGKVIWDPIPQAKYRIHSSNQIGYETNAISQFIGRLSRLFTLKRSAYTRQDRAIAETVSHFLDQDRRDILHGFIEQSTLRSRRKYLREYPLIHQSRLAGVAARLLFLAGQYRDR